MSAVVFGPNGSGKTVGLIIPNALEWRGSVVMTTAKPQDLTPVLGARALLGPVWVVAQEVLPARRPRRGRRSTTQLKQMLRTAWPVGSSTPRG